MKKIFFFISILALSLTMNAQKSNISLSGAIPLGDSKEITNFGLNLDANYLWIVSEKLDLGLTGGFHHYFGKEIFQEGSQSARFSNNGFLALAAAGRFNLIGDLSLGTDVGYALGLYPNGNNGGFYYSPKVQYSLSNSLEVVLAYKGIEVDNGSFNAFTFGLELRL